MGVIYSKYQQRTVKIQSHSESQEILCTNLPLTLQTNNKHITEYRIIILLIYNYENNFKLSKGGNCRMSRMSRMF